MTLYLLDTDHVTLQEQGHAPLVQRLAGQPPGDFAISVVTVEEVLRGRLAVLARQLDSATRIQAYSRFLDSVRFFNSVTVLSFDQPCEDSFQTLRLKRLRIGTRDTKIAAMALANNLTLLTRNRRDFQRVPGLVIDDWSVP